VGLSMGIQGTDVAKRASDIVIEDDNFASIVKTVMWGRSVYDNIRKFVQFQLTVNVVALIVALGAAMNPNVALQTPLTAVQLLWVNLIMDTLAALALATERPTPSLLERLPYKPSAHLISKCMWRFVFGHAFVQIPLIYVILFTGASWFDNPDSAYVEDGVQLRNDRHLTIVFNAFVWLQIFNEVNARRVNGEWNVISGLFDNLYFPIILVITAFLQFLIVTANSPLTNTVALDADEWIFCVGIGLTSFVTNQFVRLVPADTSWGSISIDMKKEFERDPKYDLSKVTAADSTKVLQVNDGLPPSSPREMNLVADVTVPITEEQEPLK